jgi:hypothetical protein
MKPRVILGFQTRLGASNGNPRTAGDEKNGPGPRLTKSTGQDCG